MSTSSFSSGLKNTSSNITSIRSRVNAITLLGDNVNVSTITLYDTNTGTATGNVLARVVARTSDAQNHVIFTEPVFAQDGIYAQLTGTGGNYIVYYGG